MAKQNLLHPKEALFSPFCERGEKPVYFENAKIIISKYEDKILILNPLTWETVDTHNCPTDYNPKYRFPFAHENKWILLCLDVEGNLYNTSDKSFKRVIPSGSLVTCTSSYEHYILLGLSNHTIVVYDFKTQNVVKNLTCGHGSRITFLHSHMNMFFAFSDDGILSFWRNFRFQKCFKLSLTSISSISNIDETAFVVISPDNSLIVLDIELQTLKILSFQSPVIGILKFSDGIIDILDTNGLVYKYAFGTVSKSYDIAMKAAQVIMVDDCNIFISDYYNIFHRFTYLPNQQIDREKIVVPTDYIDLPDALMLCENQFYLPCGKYVAFHKLDEYRVSRLASVFVGHDDDVLCLCNFGADLLVSASKNGELCIWSITSWRLVHKVSNIGLEGITTMASIEHGDTSLLVIGSESGFLKLLKITRGSEMLISELWVSQYHQKDINYIFFSKTNGLIVTASQDKSVCILSLNGKVLSHLKHHKRGVWSLDWFKGLLATASADKTIAILNEDYKVIHTIHGHDSPVTKVKFINSETLISGDSSGVIKLWKISKLMHEVGSSDILTGKIWSLFTFKHDLLAVDSIGEIQLICISAANKNVSDFYNPEEDKLQIHIQKGDYKRALEVAIELKKPEMAFKLIDKIILAGNYSPDFFHLLSKSAHEVLLSWTRSWLTHPRKSFVAQLILKVLLSECDGISNNDIHLLSSYTSRALNRIDDLISSSFAYKVIIDNK